MCAFDRDALRRTLRSVTLAPGQNDEDGSSKFLTALTDEVPAVLYHYTSAEAALGIIAGQQLWATHARFLNDTSELSHGLDLCRERLRTRAGSGQIAHFVNTVSQVLDMVVFDIYVACFSDGDDIIPQWKGYASAGAGYALGFDIVRAATLSNTVPLRVFYTEHEKNVILDAIIDGYIDVLERSLDAHPNEKEETAKAVGLTLASTLTQLLASFKHDIFSHEREWRLVEFVLRSNQARRSKFRSSRGVIVPYIELSLGEGGQALPVREIRCGPTSSQDVGVEGVKMLVREYGLSCSVSESAAPMRY